MKHPHKGCSANPAICIPSSEYIRHARNDEQVALKKNYVKGVFGDYFGRAIESVLEHLLEDFFEKKLLLKTLCMVLKRVSLRTTVENCFRVRFEKTFEKKILRKQSLKAVQVDKCLMMHAVFDDSLNGPVLRDSLSLQFLVGQLFRKFFMTVLYAVASVKRNFRRRFRAKIA